MGIQILNNLESEESFVMPQPVYKLYDAIEKQYKIYKDWNKMHETTLWKELCLCILSSNVNFESARSALNHLSQKGFLKSEFLLNEYSSQEIIFNELTKPLYLPPKIDGNLRKYRFPSIRAKNIVDAANHIYSDGFSIRQTLKEIDSEIEARNYLAKNISGLGLKESSHFLRNIKFSSSLAIIDVHILSFLEELGLILIDKNIISTNEYLQLEVLMQQLSKIYGMNLSILDNAIWYYMRHRQS